MSSTAVQERPASSQVVGEIMQRAVTGDLSGLSPGERAQLIIKVCETLRLNPTTGPFQLVTFKKGGMRLYATKDCADQLRKRDNVSVQIVARELLADETYVVTARATIPGEAPRTDESIGAVSLRNVIGEDRANQIMCAETKAKRRVTLSICGLGFLDESEVYSIPDVQVVNNGSSGHAEQLAARAAIAATPAAIAATPAAIAAQMPPPASPAPAAVAMISDAQKKEIVRLTQDLGISNLDLNAKLIERFKVGDIDFLTSRQADQVLGGLRAKHQQIPY